MERVVLFLIFGVLWVEVGPVGCPVGAVAEGSYVCHLLEACEQGIGEGCCREQRAGGCRTVAGNVEPSVSRGRVFVARLCEEELCGERLVVRVGQHLVLVCADGVEVGEPEVLELEQSVCGSTLAVAELLVYNQTNRPAYDNGVEELR